MRNAALIFSDSEHLLNVWERKGDGKEVSYCLSFSEDFCLLKEDVELFTVEMICFRVSLR